MMNEETTPPPTPIVQVGRMESSDQTARGEWFAAQRLASADNLEKMAREIIGLVTALLGLLLGVLALTEDPLPSYLAYGWVRVLGGASLVALVLALAAALVVVYPRHWAINNTIEEEERLFAQILRWKEGWLRWGTGLFGVGMALLATILVAVLALV